MKKKRQIMFLVLSCSFRSHIQNSNDLNNLFTNNGDKTQKFLKKS